MKTSCNWLKEYVDFTWTPAELAERLTMAGLEVEAMLTRHAAPRTVVVARILSRTKHPNADRLSLCQVDDGSGAPLAVVCGAPNCDAGQNAAFARVGTQLGKFTVNPAKIRGQESFGMLCSEQELGFSNAHEGILLLPADAPIGTPLADYLGTDTVIDWEVTPNRPDWLSHLGIAREIGALTGAPLRRPPAAPPSAGGNIHEQIAVRVDEPALCPRYTARYLRGVKIGPSPAWLQERLASVGLRPINNVVDVTNFVLFECGQPLHAFDADRLRGRQIVVRRARPGEKLATLDGREHQLTADHLLIADAEGGVALAGVMGGAGSEISAATTNVLIESAVFQPANIRRTAKTLGIATDSSYRFERGVDFDMAEFASARAAQLLVELAGAELVSGFIDVKAGPYRAPEIACRFARVNAVLGVAVPPATVRQLLAGLGLEVRGVTADQLTVAIPPHRPDLEREIDLIEEIGRLYGYERVPPTIPGGRVGGPIASDDYFPVQHLRDGFLSLGLNECVHLAFLSEGEALAGTGFGAAELVRVRNPLGVEYSVLRPSVLPSLLATVGRNVAHGNHDLRLFELARVFCRRPGTPEERLEAGLALTGLRHPERYSAERQLEHDFYDLSGALEDWFIAVGLPVPSLRPGTHPALVPGVTAEAVLDDQVLAVLGQVTAALTKDLRLRHPLFVALLQVEPLVRRAGGAHRCRGLSPFPAVSRDVAFVAPVSLAHRQVLEFIASCQVPCLEDVQLFDLFRDNQVFGAGRQSLAYSLTFRAPDRTLTDDEVNRAHEALKARLVKSLGVEIR